MPATSFSNLITFSRGTNATVTDSTGRLTYAPHNLLTFSEQFDNAAWTTLRGTTTANLVAAPDGTTTADRFVEDATTNTRSVQSAAITIISGATYTASVYLKNLSRRYVSLILAESASGLNGFLATFDLQSGTATTQIRGTGTISNASIMPAGDGWYRCSITGTVPAATSVVQLISPATTATPTQSTYGRESYAGNGTSAFYLWGAQLEAVTYQTTPSTYYPTTVKNLLGFSQDFSNAGWSKTRTVIAGCPFVNPVDGLFTANKLMVDGTATATHSVSQDFSLGASVPVTASIYVKAAEYTTGRLVLTALSGSFPEIVAIFDLTAATVTTSSSGGTTVLGSSITPLSNGWYRVSISGFTGLSGNHRFWVYPNTNSTFTGDGNSGIYIYGAQLSDSASLDPYVPTPAAAPSSTAYYGPRFDYDPVTLAPKGLLVEEARTNLLLQSENFATTWGSSNASVSTNVAVAPDGTSNADKISETAVTGVFTVFQSATTTAAAHTFTVYAKAAERSFIVLYNLTYGGGTSFNLSTGAVGSNIDVAPTSSSITSVGNGWYRCSITLTAAAASTSWRIYLASNATTTSYAGVAGNGVFLYGAQLEAGAFATSYIPTVASTVTRSADVATITGSLFSGWYNQNEGTILAQGVFFGLNQTASNGLFSASNNSFSESISIFRTSSANNISGDIIDNSVVQSTYTVAMGSQPVKAAIAYALNNSNFALNGVAQTTDTSCTIPTVDRLFIGSIYTSSGFFTNGHIRSIQYIPTRTSDTQLQTLTTG